MAVEPYDEEEVKADHSVIRRISPVQHVVWDANRDCHRVSSKAFTPSSGVNGGMSVDIEAKIIGDGVEPKGYVTTPIFMGSVSFLASAARELNLWIGYDKLRENPYHGEVWGNPRSNRFTRAQKNGLHRASNWYVPLEGVEIR